MKSRSPRTKSRRSLHNTNTKSRHINRRAGVSRRVDRRANTGIEHRQVESRKHRSRRMSRRHIQSGHREDRRIKAEYRGSRKRSGKHRSYLRSASRKKYRSSTSNLQMMLRRLRSQKKPSGKRRYSKAAAKREVSKKCGKGEVFEVGKCRKRCKEFKVHKKTKNGIQCRTSSAAKKKRSKCALSSKTIRWNEKKKSIRCAPCGKDRAWDSTHNACFPTDEGKTVIERCKRSFKKGYKYTPKHGYKCKR